MVGLLAAHERREGNCSVCIDGLQALLQVVEDARSAFVNVERFARFLQKIYLLSMEEPLNLKLKITPLFPGSERSLLPTRAHACASRTTVRVAAHFQGNSPEKLISVKFQCSSVANVNVRLTTCLRTKSSYDVTSVALSMSFSRSTLKKNITIFYK